MAAHQVAIEAFLDLIDFGIVLIDAEGVVVLANKVAQEIAREWGFAVLEDEASPGRRSPQEALLATAVGRACHADLADPRVVNEIVLQSPRGDPPLLVTVASLPATELAGAFGRPVVSALFFRDVGRSAPIRSSALLKHFGFTPAELDLANALLDGLTLDQCCQRLQRSKNTLRGRVKTMLAKAGVHRQGELLALILKTFPQIRLD